METMKSEIPHKYTGQARLPCQDYQIAPIYTQKLNASNRFCPILDHSDLDTTKTAKQCLCKDSCHDFCLLFWRRLRAEERPEFIEEYP